MAEGVRQVVDLVCRGLRDSVIGSVSIYHMEQQQRKQQKSEDEDSEGSPQRQPVEGVLARRRAERLKHREQKKTKEPRVLHRILMCCAWNGGIFWLSILLFNGVLIPSLHFLTGLIFGGSSSHGVFWGWIGPLLSWTFGALWVLPLFVLSKIINSLWFQLPMLVPSPNLLGKSVAGTPILNYGVLGENNRSWEDIADAAYRRSRGRPQLPSFGKIIADLLFSLLLQTLFLIQGMLASLLPIAAVGQLVSLLHLSLLYSLYAFEYKWFNMGWEVHRRLSHIETNWLYFLGFGLPLAVLTSLPASYIVSGCVFSILFPLFIISGNEAPLITKPYGPPLKLFSAVVAISDAIFRQSIKKTAPSSARSTPVKQVKGQQR